MSWNPSFDVDRQYGEQGEGTLRAILDLPAGSFEVKRKSRLDDKFYVELEQSPGATGVYKRSGANTTSAAYWAYVIGNTGVVVLIPTPRLRAAARMFMHRCEERDGDNPTRGRLITLREFLITQVAQEVAA